MNELALSTIELFSGVGMLGEGVRAGLAHMGIGYRTCVHVEREAHAAAVLVARMEEGSLDAAPIWSDVTTFDARAWRGKVDCVVAGFPCQDLSVAGRRAGLDGKRSGLFFEVTRIANDSGAWLIVLENVAGIASATATVMDEEEGELDERAVARVVGELADLGWNAEWIVVSASDVGASHGRARWFCIAWRMDDAECAERRAPRSTGASSQQGNDRGRSEENGRPGITEQVLADTARHVGSGSGDGQSGSRRGICEAGDTLDDSNSIGAQRTGRAELGTDVGCEVLEHAEGIGNGSGGLPVGDESAVAIASGRGASLGNAESNGWNQGRTESGRQQGRSDVAVNGRTVADPDSTRLGASGQPECGTSNSLSSNTGLFAPGPSDPRWGAILERFPEVAPALEPTFRRVVNGLDFDMGDSRAARLKCVGNGVVAAAAACAFVVLARRSGIFK